MKRIDTDEAEAYWNFAIAGPGGTGKTTMGVSAPRPLILLSERQGMPSIRLAAKRLGVPVPAVALVECADDYRAALIALRGPKNKPFRLCTLPKTVKENGKVVRRIPGDLVMELPVDQWPLTVVLDSLTDACDVLVSEIRDQSPQKPGRDGLPTDAQRFWGVLIDRATGIIKGYRDLPMHVVFLCLVSDKTKEDKDGRILERIVQPKLATKDMANSLCAAVNVLGYAYKTLDRNKNVVHGFQTTGPEGMMTKPCEPLRSRELPDVGYWIRMLEGNLEDVGPMPLAPEAMDAARGDDDPLGRATPEGVEEGYDESADPDPDADPEVFSCSQCDTIVEADGQLCDEHEAEMQKAMDAQSTANGDPPADPDPPAEQLPSEVAAAAPAPTKPAAPAMVPCKHCGKRMGVKGYNEGKRRACGESMGDCEPQL